MSDIDPSPFRRFDRRELLRRGALALAGIGAARAASPGAEPVQPAPAAQPAPSGPPARSVIQLWMAGGPPHLDTFDPKPEAGEDYAGPFRKPLATNVPGIRIGELLPRLARLADRYSIIRGMTHPSNAHETATYMMQTGTPPGADLVYPAVGAVVALEVETSGKYRGELPPYITIPSPLGRFSEAGFLGVRYKPFATGGDPSARDFRVQGIARPPSVSEERLARRRALVEALDTLGRRRPGTALLGEMAGLREKAYRLVQGEAKDAFDLAREDDALRDRYGRNRFGQSCLLARRLVERGVPFVTVNWGGWDTHSGHFEKMRTMLPVLDGGFASLLEDLAARGLLDSTIVVWGGEFGRTPKVAVDPPWNGGRHHFSAAFSCVVAGGGFRGGKVVGATDGRGERVRERPVYPWDLSASVYRLLGIDPAGRLPHPHGCVARVTPATGGDVPSGGILKEILPS